MFKNPFGRRVLDKMNVSTIDHIFLFKNQTTKEKKNDRGQTL